MFKIRIPGTVYEFEAPLFQMDDSGQIDVLSVNFNYVVTFFNMVIFFDFAYSKLVYNAYNQSVITLKKPVLA